MGLQLNAASIAALNNERAAHGLPNLTSPPVGSDVDATVGLFASDKATAATQIAALTAQVSDLQAQLAAGGGAGFVLNDDQGPVTGNVNAVEQFGGGASGNLTFVDGVLTGGSLSTG